MSGLSEEKKQVVMSEFVGAGPDSQWNTILRIVSLRQWEEALVTVHRNGLLQADTNALHELWLRKQQLQGLQCHLSFPT